MKPQNKQRIQELESTCAELREFVDRLKAEKEHHQSVQRAIRAEYDKRPPDRYPTEHALADALLSEFLIVPRSSIQGWEYGVRSTVAGQLDDLPVAGGRDRAAEFVEKRRIAQTRLKGSSDAVLIQRPILPWQIPEDGDE